MANNIVDEAEELFFCEKRHFVKNAPFHPPQGDEKHDQMPIHGKGRLDNFVVVADGEQFSVKVVVDDKEVVNNSHSELKRRQTELAHVSSYSDGGEHIVSVMNYPFREGVHITITPESDLTFDMVRVEALLE